MKKALFQSLCAFSVAAASQVALASCDDIFAAASAGGGLEKIANDVVSANQGEGKHSADNGGGFGLDMWVTFVDETGMVCKGGVVNTARAKGTEGPNIGNKSWLGSRVISAQKANTANAFSLDGFAISTANLYGLVQEGGSLYGLQHSNPIEPVTAYKGSASKFGTSKDPLNKKTIGGVNVFGGGLALYKAGDGSAKVKVGAVGVSGDTSCTDHAVAWRIRHTLVLDKVPGGFNTLGTHADTTIGDELVIAASADQLPNSWYQPTCYTAPTAGTANGVLAAPAPTTAQ